MSELQHGRDGWILSDYEWFEETGEGRFLYERRMRSGDVQELEVVRQQPSHSTHQGWTAS